MNEPEIKAIEDAYHTAIKSLFSVLVSNMAGTGRPNRDEALKRFQAGAAVAKDAKNLALSHFQKQGA